MGKKATKKKTIWRTLSIGDITPTSTTNGSTKEIKKDYKTSYKIDLTAQANNQQRSGKLSSTSSELSNNENRNSFNTNNYNSYKYNNNNNSSNNTNATVLLNSTNANTTSSTHQQQQQYPQQYNKTYLPYKRRPFSSKSLNYNYYNNNNNNNSASAGGNSVGNYYKSNYRYRINNYNSETGNNDNRPNTKSTPSSEKKESNFNEDDYTRITTPRQDVLFKKGYLSKPKKYLKYNDLNTPSSGAMSVVSTEESTTTSTQSVTPENFNSIPENPDESEFSDPYSYQNFYDQNGLYYVNPYNFDPYGGQMFMMPYPTSANCQPPFNTNPFDIYDNSQLTTTSTSPVSFNQSNENPETNETSSLPPTSELQITPDTINMNEVENSNNSNETTETIAPPTGDAIAEDNTLVNEIAVEEKISGAEGNDCEDKNEKAAAENNENSVVDYPNENAPHYHPLMYYPYYYCPSQMFPYNDLSYQNGFGIPYDNSIGNKYFKYKRRKRKTLHTLNSSGVTTDDCSEDESIDNEINHMPMANVQTSVTKCYLNVEVEEFQPKSYTTGLVNVIERPPPTVDIESAPKQSYSKLASSDIAHPELSPNSIAFVPNYSNALKKEFKGPKLSPNSTPFAPNYSNILKMESKDINNKKTAISNNNHINNNLSNKTKKKNNKKSVPKAATNSSDIKETKSQSNELTYAQMLNGVTKPISVEPPSEVPKPLNDVVKTEIAISPKKLSPPKVVDKWQTVKPKGKRGKSIQIEEIEDGEVEEETIAETSYDTITASNDSFQSSSNDEVQNTSTSSIAACTTPTAKPPSTKQKSKPKSSKKNPKRKNVQSKMQNGFEVIEPIFSSVDDGSEHVDPQQSIAENQNNLIEFDQCSFIDEVQDVINGDVELIDIDGINNEEHFANFVFNEEDELDKDFDIIEKPEILVKNENLKDEVAEEEVVLPSERVDVTKIEEMHECKIETSIDEKKVENIVEKCYSVVVDVTPTIDGKGIVIDLDEKLRNGCAIENKINGQVEEIIEKITVNEIESICNKIEEELSTDDNQTIIENVNDDHHHIVATNVEENIVVNNDIDDLCDKKIDEETEKILLSNNHNVEEKNVVTVKNENIYVKENGLSPTVNKFPLTEAVTKWLFEKENQKSVATEPILRLPDDPILSSKIQLMILSRTQFNRDDVHDNDDDDDEWITESETESENDDVHHDVSMRNKAKNFVSNPLPVSSHNSSNEDINVSVIDTDSDYMSDSQIRADDRASKRVASKPYLNSDNLQNTTTITTLSSNNHQSKLSSKNKNKPLDNSTKTIDKCIKLPFTDVCCVLM